MGNRVLHLLLFCYSASPPALCVCVCVCVNISPNDDTRGEMRGESETVSKRCWQRDGEKSTEYIFLTMRHQSFIGFHFEPTIPVCRHLPVSSFPSFFSISNLCLASPLACILHPSSDCPFDLTTMCFFSPSFFLCIRSGSKCITGWHGIDRRIRNECRPLWNHEEQRSQPASRPAVWPPDPHVRQGNSCKVHFLLSSTEFPNFNILSL